MNSSNTHPHREIRLLDFFGLIHNLVDYNLRCVFPSYESPNSLAWVSFFQEHQVVIAYIELDLFLIHYLLQ